jgi:hypothetical protein
VGFLYIVTEDLKTRFFKILKDITQVVGLVRKLSQWTEMVSGSFIRPRPSLLKKNDKMCFIPMYNCHVW